MAVADPGCRLETDAGFPDCSLTTSLSSTNEKSFFRRIRLNRQMNLFPHDFVLNLSAKFCHRQCQNYVIDNVKIMYVCMYVCMYAVFVSWHA
jgi:hypothetical protein